MKVLHINYYEKKGGASIATQQIHSALLNKKIESKIFVAEKETNDENIISESNFFSFISFKFRERFNRNLFKILNLKSANTQSSGLLRSYLPYKINKMNFDIVNLHWINNEMMSIKDLKRIRKPLVWTLHDLWPISGKDHYSNEKNNKRSLFDKFIFDQKKKNWQNLFKVICPSNWIYKKAKASEIMRNNDIRLIPHPIDAKKWERLRNKNEIKRLFNLEFDEDHKVLLFGAERASKNKRKGYHIVLETVRKISEKKKIILLIFGNEKKGVEKINQNLIIINVGYIVDRHSLLRALYSLSDIMLVPSLEEAFGLTAAEASATGTPVVTLEGTGTEDIILNNFNGIVSNENSFVNDVSNLINSKEKLEEFSINGVTHINDNFNPEKISNLYLKLYEEILN